MRTPKEQKKRTRNNVISLTLFSFFTMVLLAVIHHGKTEPQEIKTPMPTVDDMEVNRENYEYLKFEE